eukprot:gene31944-41438_t
MNIRLFSKKASLQKAFSTIGFIGVGNMGGFMAKNILTKSAQLALPHRVLIFDKLQANIDNLTAVGAESTADVRSLAGQCDIIITMLPATQHVVDVFRGDSGILSTLRPGSVIIDSSTIDPLTTKQLHEEVAAKGAAMIDAPVSGGVTGAAAGTLTFMVGGEESTLVRVSDVLNMMGKNIIHCGAAGSGGVTKLCNNLSLAISMIGTSEAMALGIRLGMDPVRLAGVMNTSTARCWSSDSYNPVPGVLANPNLPSNNEYKGGFGSGR